MKPTTQDRAACAVNVSPVRLIPRMESRIESGSNRFAALADAETVPVGTQELEDVRVRSSIVVVATEFQRPFLTHLKRIWSDPSSIGVGGWRLPDTVSSRGHTAGERHTVLKSTPDRSDICGHDHKRFRCGKPTSEWFLVSQESPTTVEVDRHTIHPC